MEDARVVVMIPRKLKAQFAKAAKEKGMSRVYVIKTLLQGWLKENPSKTKSKAS